MLFYAISLPTKTIAYHLTRGLLNSCIAASPASKTGCGNWSRTSSLRSAEMRPGLPHIICSGLPCFRLQALPSSARPKRQTLPLCQTKFAYRKNFKRDSILPPHSPTQAAGSSSLALTFPRPRPCRGDGGFSLCRFFIRAVLSALSTQRSQGTCACRLASSLAAWLIARP